MEPVFGVLRSSIRPFLALFCHIPLVPVFFTTMSAGSHELENADHILLSVRGRVIQLQKHSQTDPNTRGSYNDSSKHSRGKS